MNKSFSIHNTNQSIVNLSLGIRVIHANRVVVMKKDLDLTRKIRGERVKDHNGYVPMHSEDNLQISFGVDVDIIASLVSDEYEGLEKSIFESEAILKTPIPKF